MGNWFGDESDVWNQWNEPDESYGLDDVTGLEESQDAESHAGPDGSLGLDDLLFPENEALDNATDMGAPEAADAGFQATIDFADEHVPETPVWLQWMTQNQSAVAVAIAAGFALYLLKPLLEIGANVSD